MKRLRLIISILRARNYCVMIERKGGGMLIDIKGKSVAKRGFYELSKFLRRTKD